MKKFTQWKTFFILLSLGLVGVILIFPYILTIQGELLKATGLPIIVIFSAQLIQTGILLSITIFFGLLLSKKVGFQVPLIQAVIAKGNYKIILKNILTKSIMMGIITAVLIYVVDIIFSGFGADISSQQSHAPIWQKLLAPFYGGTVEEILMRLFLMSLLVWVGTKILRQKQPTKLVVISAIFLAAIIFGLGHLPVTAALTKITPLIVFRAVILNGIGGVVFGWLFWKKGFESAMIAHFTTDIFLITLLPLLF